MSPVPLEPDFQPNLPLQQRQWGKISFQPEVIWDWYSFGDYLHTLEDSGLAINIASLVGHGALRLAPKTPQVIGKTIRQIADEHHQDPFEVYFDLIVENGHEAEAIFDYIDEENIRILLQHPDVMISSDGQVLAPYGFLNDPPPYSPCSYGEFPGVLERYVRDEPVLALQEAIRKITSFPAQSLGLRDRGVLRESAWADIVVFDLERIHDRATSLYPHTFPFENYPHQHPEGIDYVFVNGVLVVANGEHSGALPGKVLRHTCFNQEYKKKQQI